MLQCTYRFKHITQNTDVAYILIIRYAIVIGTLRKLKSINVIPSLHVPVTN
jgi:hypothetical protein